MGPGKNGSDHVGKESQRQPLKNLHDQLVRSPNLQHEDRYRDWQDQHDRGDRNQQIDGGRNRSNIGSGINSVGNHKQGDGRVHQPTWIILAEHRRETPAAYHSDFRADELHRGHHRQGQDCDP